MPSTIIALTASQEACMYKTTDSLKKIAESLAMINEQLTELNKALKEKDNGKQ